MEFKINIEEINKDESLRQSIIDEVSEMLREDMATSVQKEVNKMINVELEKQIKDRVKARVDMILLDAIDTEFTPVDQWGKPDKPTTIREKVVDTFKKQTVFSQTRYDSDKNAFTKVLESIISEEVKKACGEYNKIIDGQFLKDVHEHAMVKLKQRLGVK
jgi:DNA-binding protein Fis